MGTEDRAPPDDLSSPPQPEPTRPDWLELLIREPWSFDFHMALRRFESTYRDKPRLGEAAHPVDEPLRVGQPPSLAFAPSAISGFEESSDPSHRRLSVAFFGLWGANGALPVHLTQYAYDRLRQAGDSTLVRFADVFHHRIFLLFHRAWAAAQPTAGLDRDAADPYALYVGVLMGLTPAPWRRDAFSDRAKLYYAGRFAALARNADGLRDVIADHLGLPATIEEFVGEWLDLQPEERWALGTSAGLGRLGQTAVVGARVWTRANKFRVVLGPLTLRDFERMLPGSSGAATLASIVRIYTNDEWAWDMRLALSSDASSPMTLGMMAKLGWTTRLGDVPGDRHDLVVDPASGRTVRFAGAS
ncbi:MAG TPA: type VI secretion system baseplate subunit TssG [Polyangiaceae bacterium]|nr:type VI secretion system baseplate subunit TssG [Polyangiaceae bacterium]